MTETTIDDLWLRYTLLPKPPPTVRDMSVEDRRAYNRARVAEHRARQREAATVEPEPTSPNVRDTLADAALAILATGAPGADEIRRVLMAVFPSKPGLPMTVSAHARSGKLKPKLLRKR
ncbi:hypothetical protein ACX3P0_07375 [Mesorhizobium sp. A556]